MRHPDGFPPRTQCTGWYVAKEHEMRDWAHPARVEELRTGRSALSRGRRTPGGPGLQVRGYRDATLLVAEVLDLPGLARAAGPDRLVAILDQLFRVADRAAGRLGLSRVAAVGGFYGVVAGVPEPRIDHADAAADLAIEMIQAAALIDAPSGRGLGVRIGLHTGPLVAALEGPRAVRELWGESTRIAERMASQGVPGLIQVSGPAAARLSSRYRLEARPGLQGARPLDAWFLMGRRRS